MIKKVSLSLILFLFCLLLYRTSGHLNSAKKALTRYQHSGKLKICIWDSYEISIVNMNSLSTIPLMGNWGTHFHFGGCALFPEGRFIAYSIHGPFIKRHTIKIFDTLNGETKDLISFDRMIMGFSISPDENQLAFVTDAENREVFIPPREGPMMKGQEIVEMFQREQQLRSQYQSLYILDMKTKGLRQIIKNNVHAISNNTWSPDGNKLIYETGNGDYFIYDFGNESAHKILSRNAANLSWSSDSLRIYYRTYNEGDNNYYSVKTDGSDRQLFLENKALGRIPLINDVGGITSPILSSPNGELIIYGRYAGLKDIPLKIYAMDMKTKNHVALGSGDVCGWSFSDEMKYYKKQ